MLTLAKYKKIKEGWPDGSVGRGLATEFQNSQGRKENWHSQVVLSFNMHEISF